MRYGWYVDTSVGKLYLAEENGYLVRLDGGDADKEDILQEISAFYESRGYFDAVWQEPILSVRGKGTARNIPALTLRFDTVEEQTYVTILQPD